MIFMGVGDAHEFRFTPLAAAASMTHVTFLVVGNPNDFSWRLAAHMIFHGGWQRVWFHGAWQRT